MKKILFVILMLLVGCNDEWENTNNDWGYTSPCIQGGRYTIIQNNYKIENTKCVFFGTDEDVIFEKDGHKIYVNGPSIIIQE